MAKMQNIETHHVPMNIDEHMFIYFVSFKKINMIQAVIVGLPVIFLSLSFLLYLDLLSFGQNVGLAFMLGLISAGFTYSGVKGDTLFGYIYSMITQIFNKRISFYNPRIKTEANSLRYVGLLSQKNPAVLIKKYIDKRKAKISKLEKQKLQSIMSQNGQEYMFDDD